MTAKIVTIVGARPQFIKAATVSRAIADYFVENPAANGLHEVMVHTGQHFDAGMSDVFFKELKIPEPRYHLDINNAPHGAMTGRMLERIEEVLQAESPDWVLVYGDTNSTLAGALAAAKLHIPVAHVEAGLRSYNRQMPEEINRIVTDHLSQVLFCPTETAVSNLVREGFSRTVTALPFSYKTWKKSGCSPEISSQGSRNHCSQALVFNVGDVMYDLMLYYKQIASTQSTILDSLGLLRAEARRDDNSVISAAIQDYCLVTVHRQENTDDRDKLRSIFEGLARISAEGINVVVPLHPRTRKCIEGEGLLDTHSDMIIIDPVSYVDMVSLESHAAAIVTDSGGIQKEAYFLGVPCITVRNETEWVETTDLGWNILAGSDSEKIVQYVRTVLDWSRCGAPFASFDSMPKERAEFRALPYGDGSAAKHIVAILSELSRVL